MPNRGVSITGDLAARLDRPPQRAVITVDDYPRYSKNIYSRDMGINLFQ